MATSSVSPTRPRSRSVATPPVLNLARVEFELQQFKDVTQEAVNTLETINAMARWLQAAHRGHLAEYGSQSVNLFDDVGHLRSAIEALVFQAAEYVDREIPRSVHEVRTGARAPATVARDWRCAMTTSAPVPVLPAPLEDIRDLAEDLNCHIHTLAACISLYAKSGGDLDDLDRIAQAMAASADACYRDVLSQARQIARDHDFEIAAVTGASVARGAR